MLLENMSMAFFAIRANKMRSFLTMLGIIIGIGSVIAIVSIGDTMRSMVADLYKEVGMTRFIMFMDWNMDDFRQSDYFTLEELERVKEVFADDIAYIDSNAYASADAYYQRNKIKYVYQGIDYNYPDVQKIDIIHGRNLNKADVLGRKNHLVLEDVGAQKLFGTDDCVGKTLRTTIYGTTSDYTVVGVYHRVKTPLDSLMGNGGQGEAAYIPYTLLTWPNDYFMGLNIYAREGSDVSSLISRLIPYVAKQKSRQPENVTYESAAAQMGMMDGIMGSMSAAVGGIAAISLVVGGIGIMNIMLVSVTERTREIGIRKALGARTRDVMIQFLTESAILSACGGIIGVAIGVGLVGGGGALFGIRVVIRLSVILLAVGFSAVVGVFFGLYPASKAAKSDPIDALRYE